MTQCKESDRRIVSMRSNGFFIDNAIACIPPPSWASTIQKHLNPAVDAQRNLFQSTASAREPFQTKDRKGGGDDPADCVWRPRPSEFVRVKADVASWTLYRRCAAANHSPAIPPEWPARDHEVRLPAVRSPRSHPDRHQKTPASFHSDFEHAAENPAQIHIHLQIVLKEVSSASLPRCFRSRSDAHEWVHPRFSGRPTSLPRCSGSSGPRSSHFR
jgi:hypothetical protein